MTVQASVSVEWRAAKQAFDKDGVAVLRGFFPPEEAREMKREVDRYIREVVPTLPPEDAFFEVKGKPETVKQMQRMEIRDPYFAALMKHERLTRLSELLLDDAVVPRGVEWFNKPARIGKPTPPHQDGYYFMLEPNEALTYWIPTERVDETNGCLRHVAGSHRRGVRPHSKTETLGFSQGITDYGPDDTKAELFSAVEPGDLVVHHSLTIHRADGNSSDRSRKALGIVTYAARAKPNAEAVQQYQDNLMKELAKKGKI